MSIFFCQYDNIEFENDVEGDRFKAIIQRVQD